MTTLAIETGIEPEYEQALIASAKKIGWKVAVVRHVPFSHVFEDLPEGLADDPDVWFHGDITACKSAQKITKWQVHAPWEALRCSNYYDKLNGRLLNQDWLLTTIRGMREDKEALYTGELVEDGTLFFRPDTNDKIFTGTLIHEDDFDKAYDLVNFYEPDPESEVIVARPRVIRAEARFLVVGGKLITGSYYRTGGQTVRLEATGSLMEIAQDMLDFCLKRGFNPAPSWVLDLAECPDVGLGRRRWVIIEVGASSCCGLYSCDTDLFMKALASGQGRPVGFPYEL